jgi:hypothetical protein
MSSAQFLCTFNECSQRGNHPPLIRNLAGPIVYAMLVPIGGGQPKVMKVERLSGEGHLWGRPAVLPARDDASLLNQRLTAMAPNSAITKAIADGPGLRRIA